jgi:hypothetical protein
VTKLCNEYINPDGTPWRPSKNQKICSDHFIGDRPSIEPDHPDYIPTWFPPRYKAKKKTEKDVAKYQRVKTKAMKRKLEQEHVTPSEKRTKVLDQLDSFDNNDMTVQKFVKGQKLLIQYLKSKHYQKLPNEVKNALDILKEFDIESDEAVKKSKVTKSKNANLSHTNLPEAKVDFIPIERKNNLEEEKENEEEEFEPKRQNKDLTNRVLSSDFKCRSYCGVPLTVMNQLRYDLKGQFKNFEKLTSDDQLVLFYRVLKSNNTFNSLAVVYDVGPRCVSHVFESVLEILFNHSDERLWWLDAEENRDIMPQSFKDNYPEVKGGIHIFDCLEVATEIPSKVAHNVQAWSNYKKGFRAKILISTAAGGLIEFVSKAYGGRATDAQIVVGSGVLKKLKKGCCVMCDKGFPCIEEDVLNRGGFFVMPPKIRQGRQLNQAERKENLKIARDRWAFNNYVDRILRSGKNFMLMFVRTKVQIMSSFFDHSNLQFLYPNPSKILLLILTSRF